jgi:hypothetical protein
MRAVTTLAFAAVVATAAAAHAEPPEAVNPNVAFGLSALPTLGGIALFAGGISASVANTSTYVSRPMIYTGLAGILIGPTLGHAYADRIVSRWLELRVVGLASMVAGVKLLNDRIVTKDSSQSCKDCRLPWTLALGGAGLVVVTTFGEVLSAPGAADDFNREHHVKVTPVIGTTPGVLFSGTF